MFKAICDCSIHWQLMFCSGSLINSGSAEHTKRINNLYGEVSIAKKENIKFVYKYWLIFFIMSEFLVSGLKCVI